MLLTRLGGARESVLENGSGTVFPLRICERAWWLKVDLISKPGQTKRGGKATKGPAPMEVDEVRETETPEARSAEESTVTTHTKHWQSRRDQFLRQESPELRVEK